MSLVAQAALGIAAVTAGGLTWGAAESAAFTTRRVTVPCLPPGTPSASVLHVSDFHVAPWQRRKLSWIASLAELEPDLVVDTGDNLGHRDSIGPLLEAMAGLLQRPGLYVNGSNDYYAPKPLNPFKYFRGPSKVGAARVPLPVNDLLDGFGSAGWLDLNNARARIEVAGVGIDIVGLDDPHIRRDALPAPVDVAAPALTLGLVHAPYRRALDALTEDGAQLILAGHTHGGQVRMPGVGALVTNCDLDRRRARGLHGWPAARPDRPGGADSRWLHVSAGAGTSPYAPVRFACRPEATLLRLTAADRVE